MNWDKLKACDVVWDSPSADSAGSMPLGNGDIGINIWVESNGDLVFYLAKTDAWDQSTRLLKVGRVRVRLMPALVQPLAPFSQRLSLREGAVLIQAGGAGGEVRIRAWVDAQAPVVRLELESDQPVTVLARTEIWRTQSRPLTGAEAHSAYGFTGAPEWLVSTPDTLVADASDHVIWYHHNTDSCGPALLRERYQRTGQDGVSPHRAEKRHLYGP